MKVNSLKLLEQVSEHTQSDNILKLFYLLLQIFVLFLATIPGRARSKVRRHCSYDTCCGQTDCDPKSKHPHVTQLLASSFYLLQFRLLFLYFSIPSRRGGKGKARGEEMLGMSLSSAYVRNTCWTRFIIVPRVVS